MRRCSAVLLVLCLLLSGCIPQTEPEPREEDPSPYSQLLFPGEDRAEALAEGLERYFPTYGTPLPNFTERSSADEAALLSTALQNTPELTPEFTVSGTPDSLQMEGSGPGDRLYDSIHTALEQGLTPYALCYGEEVEAALLRLFGEGTVCSPGDCFPYTYLPEQQAYIRCGDYAGPRFWSIQLLSYQEGPEEITCRFVLTRRMDGAAITVRADGKELPLTGETLPDLQSRLTHYRAALLREGERWVLSELEQEPPEQ